ncbi:hypothetical protein WDW89_15115 [Deltaproteobacteria bacterium TL4]
MGIENVLLISLMFFWPTLMLDSGDPTREEFPLLVQLISINMSQAQKYGFDGVAIGDHLHPILYVGMESFVKQESYKISNLEAEGTFLTNQMIDRFFTWEESGFYLQLGMVHREWQITGQGRRCYTIPNILSQCSNKIEVVVDFPSSAYSWGLGWNWVNRYGFSGGIGFETIEGKPPTVKLTDRSRLIPEEYLAASKLNWENKMLGYYRKIRIVTLSLGWNF